MLCYWTFAYKNEMKSDRHLTMSAPPRLYSRRDGPRPAHFVMPRFVRTAEQDDAYFEVDDPAVHEYELEMVWDCIDRLFGYRMEIYQPDRESCLPALEMEHAEWNARTLRVWRGFARSGKLFQIVSCDWRYPITAAKHDPAHRVVRRISVVRVERVRKTCGFVPVLESIFE